MEAEEDKIIAIRDGKIVREALSASLLAELSSSTLLAFTIIHGISVQELFAFADLTDIAKEEIHLRKLLHIRNHNRRVLEEQEAKYGTNQVPIHILNALRDEQTQIIEIATRIKQVVSLVEELRRNETDS